jgi:hypothetical protein
MAARKKRKAGLPPKRGSKGKKSRDRLGSAGSGRTAGLSKRTKRKAKGVSTADARSYSDKTLKLLFAFSLNHCAFPGCTNPIGKASTKWSDPVVLARICHIYAAKDNGPRGKPDLTPAQRRAYKNLILMCGEHHTEVDEQWETYPATLLKTWKAKREALATAGTAEALKREEDIQKHAFLEVMSDEQIEKDLTHLRQCRLLAGFDATQEAQRFAAKVERSIYSGGSGQTRARALAWCARVLSTVKPLKRAKELLKASQDLAATPEAIVAQAFIDSESNLKRSLVALKDLDTNEARTAALRIVGGRKGNPAGIEWFRSGGLTLSQLDPEGKMTLITAELMEEQWDAAFQHAEEVTPADFDDCPVLMHMVAMARLLTAVHPDFRAAVFTQVPLEADLFSLGATDGDMVQRRFARDLFERAGQFGIAAGVSIAANMAADFALWLGLRDPETHELSLNELSESVLGPARSLRRVNLALRFKVAVDIPAVEAQIDRDTALTGQSTADHAYTRLAIALAKNNAKEAAEYIEQHRELLYEQLFKPGVLRYELATLAKAGLATTARERLDQAIAAGMEASLQSELESILAACSGTDEVSDRRAHYEARGDFGSLLALVHALEAKKLWRDILPLAERVFSETRAVEDLERLARCLDELGRYEALATTLEKQPSLVAQSEHLKYLWAWTLHREGRFKEASEAADKISDGAKQSTWVLRVNIAVASGDWSQLLVLTQEAWVGRAQYTADALLRMARLSLSVDGPHTRDFVLAAIEKAPDDPQVLAGAYFLAVRAGWERREETASWLKRAAELSGDSGPIQHMSLMELAERQPAWDRQAQSTWTQLKQGNIPAFAAGQLLHRSLLDLYLAPSLRNVEEADPRRRLPIFAYSGARLHVALEGLKTLAVDPAALMTFSRIGLVGKVLRRYKLIVPHGILGWLLVERDKAVFHQPSRIKDAQNLRHLIANKVLKIALLPQSPSLKLQREVGPNLAKMLSAAMRRSSEGLRTLVVRSRPVLRAGSFGGEEADVAEYEDVLCSCSAVVEQMSKNGALTQLEVQRARDYLRLHEPPSKAAAAIEDGTELYLDDLSITYLNAAGVLAKLKTAGIVASIGPWADEDAGALIDLASIQGLTLQHIEDIRSELAAGIAAGNVTVGRAVKTEDADGDLDIRTHPTFASLEVIGSDALVIDDRYINRLSTIASETATRPVLTSMDVLRALQDCGEVSRQEYFAHRTVMRQAGYQVLGVTRDELVHHMRTAPVVNKELVETADLKAIRESLIGLRLHGTVQLPLEMPFMQEVISEIETTIDVVWETNPSVDDARARCDYLLWHFDPRNWASTAMPGNESKFAIYSLAASAIRLSSHPQNLDEAHKVAYFAWVTERILTPAQSYQPEVHDFVVSSFRQRLVSGAKELVGMQGEAFRNKRMEGFVLMESMKLIAPVIRDEVLSDGKVRDEFGLKFDAVISFPGMDLAFARSKLFAAVRASGAKPRKVCKVADEAGREWTLTVTRGKSPNVVLRFGKSTLQAGQFLLLTGSRNQRLAYMQREADRLNLPSEIRTYWTEILKVRALTDDEQWEWTTSVSHSPVLVANAVIKAIFAANVSIETLVPRSIEYYERLVGKFGGQKDITQYCEEVLAGHIEQLLTWRTQEGLHQSLLLGMHSLVVDIVASRSISDSDFNRLADWALGADVIAREAVLELALKRTRSTRGIRRSVEALANRFCGQGAPEPHDQFDLIAAAYALVDGELGKLRRFVTFPPYWRRLAAFAQAALIVRCVLASRNDQSGFVEWMRGVRMDEFDAQGYADLRVEPRWRTAFASAEQLKQELAGRLFLVATDHEAAVKGLKLKEILLGEETKSLKSQLDMPQVWFAGPLEGSVDPIAKPDDELLRTMQEELAKPIPEFNAFAIIANAGLFLKFPEDMPQLVASAVRRVQYHLGDAGNTQRLLGTVLGLAGLAATNRSTELADEVIVLMRHYRHFYSEEMSAVAALHTGLVACASRSEETAWCKCVGNLVAELGSAHLTRDVAGTLLTRIRALCDLVPQLWAACGPGIAAIEAVATSS